MICSAGGPIVLSFIFGRETEWPEEAKVNNFIYGSMF